MDKKLQRDENNKVLAGVAAGLAEYFDIDVILVRLLFLLMVILGFSGVLVYLILWIVVPAKPLSFPFGSEYKMQEGDPYSYQPEQFPNIKKRSQAAPFLGLFFIALGIFFLLNQFGYIPEWFDLFKLWPLVLIFVGILFLAKSGKRREIKKEDPNNLPDEDRPLN